MANVGAGLFQGMPVSTSLSASSLNDHSGARTGLASLTSGVIVLLTLLVLAPLFSDLPKPVLAALIIEAVVMGMMDVPEMRRLARVQRFDFWIAIAAIVGDAGVRRARRRDDRDRAVAALADLGGHAPADAAAGPGARNTRSSGSWTSTPTTSSSPASWCSGWTAACSSPPRTRSRTGSARSSCRTPASPAIVLDCEGIDFIDSQGAAKMREILELAEQAGVDSAARPA